jgi:PAP2 superfamily
VAEVVESNSSPSTTVRLSWWREVACIAIFYVGYSAVRNRFGSAAVSPARAYRNAARVIDIERSLHAFVERDIQSAFTDQRWFMWLWNVHYGTLHFVVTAFALIAAFRRVPHRYSVIRNTLASTTGLAIVGFASMPLMPPRLLNAAGDFGGAPFARTNYGIVDSLVEFGGLWSFDSGTMQNISNQYAAMPSLHIGWSLWCVMALWPVVHRPWLRALLISHPVLTLFSIIVTGNHFWIDGIGGAIALGCGYGVAKLIELVDPIERWRATTAR